MESASSLATRGPLGSSLLSPSGRSVPVVARERLRRNPWAWRTRMPTIQGTSRRSAS